VTFVITRQYVMYAECDIVMANPYVCLSVCPFNAGIVSKHIIILYDGLVGISFKFLSPTAVTKFQGEPPWRGRWIHGDGEIFCNYRFLSRKRYEIHV